MDDATGLTPWQEVVEVDLPDLRGAKQTIDAALAQKPAHRIISLSVTSWGEFSHWGTALIVIEFLPKPGATTPS